MPLARNNPGKKCWINSLMVILNVFHPFLELLNFTDRKAKLSQALTRHFKNPAVMKNNNQVIDTTKTIEDLKTALRQKHSKSDKGNQFSVMLDSKQDEDPHESWMLLHEMLRPHAQVENGNASEDKMELIGLHKKNVLTCKVCGKSRETEKHESYLSQALHLYAIRQTSCSSIQAAIQQAFSSSEVQASCCQGGETPHTSFTECIRGEKGLVLYTTISGDIVKDFRTRKIEINRTIRLPFQGHNSKVQSSFRLVGFTASPIELEHHVAVIYDANGQPWTYDDAVRYKGLPKTHYAPLLLFYEREQQQVQVTNIRFETQARQEKRPALRLSSLVQVGPPPASGNEEVAQITKTKSGRSSQRTNFYRPPHDTRDKATASLQAQDDRAQQETFSDSSSTGDSTPASSPTRGNEDAKGEKLQESTPVQQDEINAQNSESCQTPTPRAQEQQDKNKDKVNPLAARFPADTWVWVRQQRSPAASGLQGSYLAGRIVGPASYKYMKIQCAYTSQQQKVHNSRILRKLELKEERIVFSRPRDSGRTISLAKVKSLLNSQGNSMNTPRPSSSLATTQEYDDQSSGYSGLVFTDATANWDTGALQWLLQSDTLLCPTMFAGLPNTLPSKVPYDCFSPNQDFPAHPSFGNCLKEVGLLILQVKEEDMMHERLFAWIHLLPIILLRAPGSNTPKEMSRAISKRCTQFLQGEWEQLYIQARRDAEKLSERAARKDLTRAPAESSGKVQQAMKCIRRGNLSKGARILYGNGSSKDPHAYNEMVSKHPQNVEPAKFPDDYVPEPIIEEERLRELDKLLSLENLARVANNFPAESHPDQWGWRPREYIAPLLHAPIVGDILVDVLIRPRREGSLPKSLAECYRGGLLIALSKAPKPGVRPIAIGDAFRRVIDKAMQSFSKKDLAHMFENTYPNVKQFASGSSDGAEKFLVTSLLALREDPAPTVPPQPLEEDPTVMLQLDVENAFNELHRQVVFDMITRKFDTTYAKGRLTADNTTKLPSTFTAHIPSIQGHYQGDGQLIFVDAQRQAHKLTSRTGTQQGCVLGGKLFNIGTFSVIGTTMADHPEVFCPMFSDNIALVGKMSKVFPAAEDLRGSLEEIGLRLKPAESGIYIPSYIQQDESPQLLDTMRDQYSHFKDTPWLKEGITMLGCPVGTDTYVHSVLEKACEKISERAERYMEVDDGLVHLQLQKFSTNAMLPYFLRTTSPALTTAHAQQVDALIWQRLLDFSEVPLEDREKESLFTAFKDARCQAALPIAQGGLGLTPNECVATPAFYTAVSKALRFAVTMKYDPISSYIASPDFHRHPLIVAYDKARNDLLQWGAIETEQLDSVSQPPLTQQRAPLAGDNPAAPKKKNIKPVLPKVMEVLLHSNSGPPLHFPDQRALTRLAQAAHPCWSADSLAEEGKLRTAHLSKQTIKADCTSGETAAYLQSIGKFRKDQKITHSPLAFTTHTESLKETYTRDLFAVWISYTLGLPAPTCLQERGEGSDKCESCQQPMDAFGHHRMSCQKTASFMTAHTHLATGFAEVMYKSSIPYTEKGVPTHLKTNEKGDALCNISNGAKTLVLDYTVVHPQSGTTGKWNSEALANSVRNKWNRHGPSYAVLGFAFSACAATTYGRLDSHLLRLLYIAAKKRAELLHVYHRPLTNVDHLFGISFAQSRARIGAAVAKGMALRALGTSAMGVSKVFLRHIAPALYRDQDLASGPHFSAGHAQWRHANAA
jgi:hypothetical protein